MTDILVFIPGLLGSELRDAQGQIWPGSLWDGAVGMSDDKFQRLLHPDLEVGDVVQWACGVVDIYARWLRIFRSIRRDGDALFSDDGETKTLYTVPYDWRLAIETSVEKRLAPALDAIAKDHEGEAEIHLVAHSLGGLLARYYLQSGRFDARPGFAAIKTFTTFGTPHNGAPIALAAALGKQKTNFLSREQGRILADSHPALYQILPLADSPIVWRRESHERLRPVQWADQPFATEELRLNGAHLELWRTFRATLDARQIPANVRCFLVVGTHEHTLTHFLWDGADVEPVYSARAGDGTVSIPGAYRPGLQTLFTSQSHVNLIRSGEAAQVFLQLFEGDAFAALVEGELTLTVHDLAVETGGDVHVKLQAHVGVHDLDGRIVWERGKLPGGKERIEDEDFGVARDVAPVQVTYSGAPVEAIDVRLAAPQTGGIYRLAYVEGDATITVSPSFSVSQY